MRLIRTHEIQLKWDGEKVTALAKGGGERVEGFGADVPAALEDLVQRIRTGDVRVWAPRWAKQSREGEVSQLGRQTDQQLLRSYAVYLGALKLDQGVPPRASAIQYFVEAWRELRRRKRGKAAD